MLVQLRTGPGAGSAPPEARVHASSTAGTGRAWVDADARVVRYVRVSLTDRCNLRCTYCMPEGGIEHVPREDVLSFEEVVAIARVLAGRGVTKVRLTGGEPTLRRELPELVARLRAVSSPQARDGQLAVHLTTNGLRLAELAEPLARAGLSGLTVSLDTLRPERFATITRADALQRVLRGIEAARDEGLPGRKLNVVAIHGFNEDELAALATYAWDHQMVPRFIETMPMSGGALYVPGALMPASQVRAAIASALGTDLRPTSTPAAADAGPATYWEAAEGPWAGAQLGTIGAMTENFCASCNRLRITARGALHGCLAHDDALDLRGALRAGGPDAVAATLDLALGQKRPSHQFQVDGRGGPSKPMIGIGG